MASNDNLKEDMVLKNHHTYENIYLLRNRFRYSGGRTDRLNITDNPGRFYFRLFFYFNDGGLLDTRVSTPDQYSYVDSAMNYLDINCENERKELLNHFITLLSNINTYSPWYFSEIGGLDQVMARKMFVERDFKIDETRPMITIKCLPDAFDTRIGTLLDLYKSVCYSYIQKKEVVPANLRKFRMGMYIFQAPKKMIHNFSNDSSSAYATFTNSIGKASHKYLEFVNCEFILSSSATPYSTLDNKEGTEQGYEIAIMFDDVFEERYNDILLRTISDFVLTDMKYLENDGKNLVESIAQTDNDERNHSMIRENIVFERHKTPELNIDGDNLWNHNRFLHNRGFSKFAYNTKSNIDSMINKMEETYNVNNIVKNLSEYSISRLDNAVMANVNTIVTGNLFHSNLTNSTTNNISQNIKYGNLGGVIDTINSSFNNQDDSFLGWTKTSIHK